MVRYEGLTHISAFADMCSDSVDSVTIYLMPRLDLITVRKFSITLFIIGRILESINQSSRVSLQLNQHAIIRNVIKVLSSLWDAFMCRVNILPTISQKMRARRGASYNSFVYFVSWHWPTLGSDKVVSSRREWKKKVFISRLLATPRVLDDCSPNRDNVSVRIYGIHKPEEIRNPTRV